MSDKTGRKTTVSFRGMAQKPHMLFPLEQQVIRIAENFCLYPELYIFNIQGSITEEEEKNSYWGKTHILSCEYSHLDLIRRRIIELIIKIN